jgi:acetyl esterase
MSVQSRIVLEPSAQGIVDATSTPPFLYELEPAQARKVLDDLQAAPVEKLPIEEEWITVPAAVGDVRVRIVKPVGSSGMMPVIVYMHGGGWILGNAGTHDRLVRELAVGARAALLFVEYPNSAEAHYPVAIEQGYAIAQWAIGEGAVKGLDASRMAVAGESVGGDMAAALTLMAKERGDVKFVQTSMYYPVTDEVDPPRDEGEAYAAKLREAGVLVTTVRYDGVVHDFMLLNAMSDSRATRAAIAQATAHLCAALGTAEGPNGG